MTDANVVLHRIPPGTKLAGTLDIDEEAAKRAVGTIADGLGVDVTQAAQAIIDIANENMHAALRVVSIERGFDPREFGLIAFGGAGPLHANALGRLIHAEPVVIPAAPGVLSAFGFQVAEVQNEFAPTYLKIAEDTPADDLRGVLTSLRDEAGEWLTRETWTRTSERSASTPTAATRCRTSSCLASCGSRTSTMASPSGFARSSEDEHRRRYGFDLDAPIEIATLRVVGASTTSEEVVEPAAGKGVAQRPPQSARSRCSSTASGTAPASTTATRSAPVTRCRVPRSSFSRTPPL